MRSFALNHHNTKQLLSSSARVFSLPRASSSSLVHPCRPAYVLHSYITLCIHRSSLFFSTPSLAASRSLEIDCSLA